jgi:hypothetical protein
MLGVSSAMYTRIALRTSSLRLCCAVADVMVASYRSSRANTNIVTGRAFDERTRKAMRLSLVWS